MSEGLGSLLGELGQRGGSGLGQAWWGVCVQRVSGCWGSDLGWGSWEDWRLVLWNLRGDFRFGRGKWFALHSGQFLFPTLLSFSLGVRKTLPTTAAGTVINAWAGENTQILATCSVGSLTAQERKESEELWLPGRSQGITLGKSPALMPRVKGSHARGSRKSGSHVVKSKELPPALECFSSSVRCGSLDCLMLCLLKPKEKR